VFLVSRVVCACELCLTSLLLVQREKAALPFGCERKLPCVCGHKPHNSHICDLVNLVTVGALLTFDQGTGKIDFGLFSKFGGDLPTAFSRFNALFLFKIVNIIYECFARNCLFPG